MEGYIYFENISTVRNASNVFSCSDNTNKRPLENSDLNWVTYKYVNFDNAHVITTGNDNAPRSYFVNYWRRRI